MLEYHNNKKSDFTIAVFNKKIQNPYGVVKTINNIENSNGLENFELSEESPQLFNSDSENLNEKIDGDSDKDNEEDELEIPAFLRRQKN